ncbi:unnamed protein product [Pleuronectes platessa]|uniref:Uncharacterized protein n=1 Tax=Pleuronectes platessa TaxID=8262 RepID=A0A9N7U1K2_PLEPL|nr:unnamed protein product [Pleuronectes platessa]
MNPETSGDTRVVVSPSERLLSRSVPPLDFTSPIKRPSFLFYLSSPGPLKSLHPCFLSFMWTLLAEASSEVSKCSLEFEDRWVRGESSAPRLCAAPPAEREKLANF